MSAALGILVVLILSGITVHTASYAAWNWKEGNRAGSIFLYLLCLVAVAMPLFLFFFRT